MKKGVRQQLRSVRKARIRRKIKGTLAKPRLCVYKSLKYTYVQLVSDEGGNVIAAANTKGLIADGKSERSVETARLLGLRIAELAKSKHIESVVFDRNGYIYHGRVAAVAGGAREGGLRF